jgi:hypothetical protein
MSTFNLEVNPKEIGEKILETEYRVLGKGFRFQNLSSGTPTKVEFPEFIGNKGTFQVNTLDGITGTKRRIKLITEAPKPTGTMYLNDIDADDIHLATCNPLQPGLRQELFVDDKWVGDAKIVNEIISIIHVRQLALTFWYPEDKDNEDDRKFFNRVGLIGYMLRTIFVKSGYSVGYEENESPMGTKVPCINVYSGKLVLYTLGIDEDPWRITTITRRHVMEVAEMGPLETLLVLLCHTINSLESGVPMFTDNL